MRKALRHDLILFRLPAIRAQFSPKVWRSLRRVRLQIADHVVYVDIVDVEEVTCRGGRRRWLLCSCQRRTSIVGFDLSAGRIVCRGCSGWRSRPVDCAAPSTEGALSI